MRKKQCQNDIISEQILPVRVGIVDKASHDVYSSGSNYVSDSGLLKIEKADFPIVDVLNLNNFTKYNEY